MYDSDNKVMGTVGALVGALLGIGIWCLIGLAGKIAVIGGVAIFLGAFGGYFLLGKDMSKVGVVIAGVIVLVSVYFATRLNYGISLYRAMEGEMSFGECYSKVLDLLAVFGEKGSFYKDLVIGYLITIVGGIGALAKLGVIGK